MTSNFVCPRYLPERGCMYILKLVPTVLKMEHNDVKS